MFAGLVVPGFVFGDRRLTAAGEIIGAIGIAITYAIRIRNRIVATTEQLRAASQLIEIAEQKKATLIPQLVTVVKAAAAHERKVLTTLGVNFGDTKALFEEYTNLSTDQNFRALQQELVVVEQDITVAGGYHAEAVAIAKTRREVFPDRFFIPSIYK
jgi:hypothetical protein